VRVTVRLFAGLRDIAGAPELVREVPAGSTLRDVWDALEREHAGLGRYRAAVSAARNEDYARMDTVVHEGDEVAFLPPVSGG
jgi:molybdopterin converting factor subunit 1